MTHESQTADAAPESTQETGTSSAPARALIEIGVVAAGPLDAIDRRAITLALDQVREFLADHFPAFDFQLLQWRRPELAVGARVEPSVLLQQAVEDRDLKRWDFVFVVTAAELQGSFSPYCFAALSRPLDAAAISLGLIDPIAAGEAADDPQREERIAHRLSRLMLHALGHLTGLGRSDDAEALLYRPTDTRELDAMHRLHPEELEQQRHALAEIADQRLEEGEGRRLSQPAFMLRAAWINRREILEAILAARPWQFPKRLSRLSIAAMSTLTVLFLTAEVWDLALAQARWQVGGLCATTLALTTVYVVVRQQLLVRRGRKRSEQNVVTSASAFGVVFAGMLSTWLVLCVIGLSAATLLFPAQLIANWAESSGLKAGQLGAAHNLQMSLFCASVGLLIGALGASFESQTYFRHVIFVDEEI